MGRGEGGARGGVAGCVCVGGWGWGYTWYMWWVWVKGVWV